MFGNLVKVVNGLDAWANSELDGNIEISIRCQELSRILGEGIQQVSGNVDIIVKLNELLVKASRDVLELLENTEGIRIVEVKKSSWVELSTRGVLAARLSEAIELLDMYKDHGKQNIKHNK